MLSGSFPFNFGGSAFGIGICFGVMALGAGLGATDGTVVAGGFSFTRPSLPSNGEE